MVWDQTVNFHFKLSWSSIVTERTCPGAWLSVTLLPKEPSLSGHMFVAIFEPLPLNLTSSIEYHSLLCILPYYDNPWPTCPEVL